MQDQSPTHRISPLPDLFTNPAKRVLSALHDDCEITWRIIGVPALPAVPLPLIEEERIVCLPNCGHHDQNTTVLQSSYLSTLIDCDDRVDVNHDPTQPSDVEKCMYGWIVATQKARERWLQTVVDLASSEYPFGVEQACRDHTHTKGWEEDLDERVLLRDISEAPSDIRSTFWQNYVILYLLFHTNHTSEKVRTILRSREEDLVDALRVALSPADTPQQPRRQRTQITSLLRALFILAGGAVNHLQDGVSVEYTTGENRDLLRSIFGITGGNDFEEYDAEKMQRSMSGSPMFSGVTLSGHDLEQRTTTIVAFLYLGYPPNHLGLPTQALSELSIGQMKMFETYLAYSYQQIPALARRNNGPLFLLIWSQQTEIQHCESLKRWLKSNDAWELYQSLIQDVQAKQPLDQLAITMAALMSFLRLCPDHDDDRAEPLHQSYVADMHAYVTGQPLGHSGKVLETMMHALIRWLRQERFEGLLILLETALNRDQPPLHILDGLNDEYIRWRVTGLSHTSTMKLVDAKLLEMQLRPSFDRLSITTDQRLDIARYVGALDIAIPANGQHPHPDCYKVVRVSRLSITEGEALVCLLDDKFENVEVPIVESLSDGSWEVGLLKTSVPHVVNAIRDQLPASDIDLAYNPLEPTTKDLDEWTYVNAATLNTEWFVKRALRIVIQGTTDEGMTLAARIYSYRLKTLTWIPGLGQHVE